MKLTFEDWMTRVDTAVQTLMGCSMHDLADYAYHDCYDSGLSPMQTAKRAIRHDRGED